MKMKMTQKYSRKVTRTVTRTVTVEEYMAEKAASEKAAAEKAAAETAELQEYYDKLKDDHENPVVEEALPYSPKYAPTSGVFESLRCEAPNSAPEVGMPKPVVTTEFSEEELDYGYEKSIIFN